MIGVTVQDLLRTLRPELLALGAALVVVLVDLAQPRGSRRWLGWFSAALALALLGTVLQQWSMSRLPLSLWAGVVVVDRLGLAFKAIFLLAVAVVSIGSADYAARRFRHAGEYYGLLFFSALGMMLMASSGDLLTLYLGVELTTLSLYVLVAYAKDQPRSGEAGLKYIILGAVASATYIYGTSLIYGSAGTTRFASIAQFAVGSPGLVVGAAMVLAALAFKVAAVPFHMWAPDVYQGAPTPVTAFLSTASKAAGFAALIRVLYGPMQAAAGGWVAVVMVLAALSMVIGNLLAIPQRNIKRMLAYSGIAQAGYALVGVASLPALGYAPQATLAVVFFLFQYMFTNLGAFLVVSMVGAPGGDDSIESYHGLSRRNPVLALALLVLLLSLGGIPPLSGFWGKLFLFWAAINAGQYALVLIGVLASVVSLYYYLMVARAMYIEPAEERPVVVSRTAAAVAVLICVVFVVALAYPTPILGLASQAALSFPGGLGLR
jgi:NADH-quinone oxidoreductase subunit N